MAYSLDELKRERRLIRESLRATVAKTRRIASEFDIGKRTPESIATFPLLAIAEGLIASHKAAKIDDDGMTLDLIEDALSYVGKRLARERPQS